MALLNLGYGGNIVGLLGLALLIWVIYDTLAVQKRMSGGMKTVWIILSLIIPIIVPIVYYFVAKK